MNLSIFERQLRLLVLMTRNRNNTVEELAEMLNMTSRTVYRYINLFREMGFVICKHGSCYHLDPSSPFFLSLSEATHFTEAEAMTLLQLLKSVQRVTPQVRHLKQKLSNLYDLHIFKKNVVDEQTMQNIEAIYEGLKKEHICILKGYMSPSTGKRTNRIVEPFMFLPGNTEVRCYELSSKQNKTFKVGRAESVEVLNQPYKYRACHKPFYTDLFHFCGEKQYPIRLSMGTLSATLLLEEYPDSAEQLQDMCDGRYVLETKVCSYVGIGRFVLGLLDDIKVLQGKGFKKYLSEKVVTYNGLVESFETK